MRDILLDLLRRLVPEIEGKIKAQQETRRIGQERKRLAALSDGGGKAPYHRKQLDGDSQQQQLKEQLDRQNRLRLLHDEDLMRDLMRATAQSDDIEHFLYNMTPEQPQNVQRYAMQREIADEFQVWELQRQHLQQARQRAQKQSAQDLARALTQQQGIDRFLQEAMSPEQKAKLQRQASTRAFQDWQQQQQKQQQQMRRKFEQLNPPDIYAWYWDY